MEALKPEMEEEQFSNNVIKPYKQGDES